MAQYLLTQEDIDRLGIIDAIPGDAATADEMVALGVKPANTAPDGSPIAPPDVPVEQQVTGTTAPITPPVPAPAPAPADGAQVPYSMTELMAALQGVQGLQAGQETQDDPYSKMSKTQRRMLAFAAISDAGRALQGKEGTMVQSLLGDFTKRADQARKAAATTQARAMMGMVAQNMQSIADPRERLELLNNYMMQGVIDPAIYTAMASQITNQINEVKAQEAASTGAAGALNTIKDIQDLVAQNAGLTTGAVGFVLSKVPFTDAAALTDLIDTLRSKMALGALRELKAGGATLGSVSAPELELLESDIAKLNPARGVEFLTSQLEKVQKRYEMIVRDAYNRDDVDKAKLLEVIGARPDAIPEWLVKGSNDGGSIVPNEEDL